MKRSVAPTSVTTTRLIVERELELVARRLARPLRRPPSRHASWFADSAIALAISVRCVNACGMLPISCLVRLVVLL